MSQIRIDLAEPLIDGMDIKFQAPCDCTGVTGLLVYYPGENEVQELRQFVFKDAHGNVLTGQGNLFAMGAYVKVIVDVPNGIAYLQNADTNGYLERKFDSKMDSGSLSPTKVLVSDAIGRVTTSTVTVTELSYLAGVTSGVQSQLNGKAAVDHSHDYLPQSGGKMEGVVTLNGIILTEGVDYGTGFPENAPTGKLFFKKVTS